MVPLLRLLTSAALASAECTREGLLAAASSCVAAITAGTISTPKLSSSNFTYMENYKNADFVKSVVLAQPLKIDLTRSTADTVACASYTIISTASGSKPFILATQLRHPGDDTSTISLVDTIAATTGSLFFNAKKPSNTAKSKTGPPWPPRSGLSENSSKNTATTTSKCGPTRTPQGASRGGSTKPNGNRRYVIDETMGSVDILCSFDSIGNYPDSHEFRVGGGKMK